VHCFLRPVLGRKGRGEEGGRKGEKRGCRLCDQPYYQWSWREKGEKRGETRGELLKKISKSMYEGRGENKKRKGEATLRPFRNKLNSCRSQQRKRKEERRRILQGRRGKYCQSSLKWMHKKGKEKRGGTKKGP